MKKTILVLLIAAAGCGRAPQEKDAVVIINEYRITKQEFAGAYKDSSFSRRDSPESRVEFLNNLIDRQLILQEAQREDIDKSEKFIAMVQKFWEQSLLKAALEKKSREISDSVTVDDRSVEEAYGKMVSEGKTDKALAQMYQQIKWELKQEKESRIMDEWLSGLRNDSRVEINWPLLNSNE